MAAGYRRSTETSVTNAGDARTDSDREHVSLVLDIGEHGVAERNAR
jgi:hypothetical protein